MSARSALALGQLDEAAAARHVRLSRVRARRRAGESAQWLVADVAEARGDWREAARAFDEIVQGGTTRPALAHLRAGRASLQAGDRDAALKSFSARVLRVSTDRPRPPTRPRSWRACPRASRRCPPIPRSLLGRATQLFGARRYADARKAFERVALTGTAAERSLADLRLAQCDFFLKKYAAAREALGVYLARARERLPEAQLYYLGTLRELGRTDEYLAGVRIFVEANAKDPLAEQALNELGTHFILADDDERAAAVFLEMYDRYPAGAFADRAAWKAGWWAYRKRDFATVVRLFESAAVTFRRADYRPAWLYWAARARDADGRSSQGRSSCSISVVADYRNSYYGREATREAERLVRCGQACGWSRGRRRARPSRPPPRP